MLDRDEFRITGLGRTLLLRVRRRGEPATPQRLLDEAAFLLRSELESGTGDGEQLASEILRTLGVLDRTPSLLGSARSSAAGVALAEVFEREIRRGGRVHVEVVPDRIVTAPAVPRPPPLPRPPPRTESEDTFYDVRFVDETGQGVGPFDVEFALGGETRDVRANGGGIALLEQVRSLSATIRISDVAELDKALDPRWQRFRPQRAPNESNTTELVFAGQAISGIAVKPVVPNRIILQPPLGSIVMELYDKTGKVLHRNRSYTIVGPMSFAGQTDDQGRLQHHDVFPGDYTLKLTLEFFEEADRQRTCTRAPSSCSPPPRATPRSACWAPCRSRSWRAFTSSSIRTSASFCPPPFPD